jgi:hypothetical protein
MSQSREAGRWSRGVAWLFSAAPGLLALAALGLLWRGLGQTLVLLNWPYPTDTLEGTLLHEARLLRAGEALYQPLELYRFVSAPYPPLHPVVITLADLWAGPHMFWGGRMVSFIAALTIGALVVLIVRRASGSWLAGGLAAALFLSAPPVVIWAARIKPDMGALVWTALGLLLATRALMRDDRRPRAFGLQPSASSLQPSAFLVGAIVCFVCAFSTKQTAVAAPLAVGLALLAADMDDYRAGLHLGYVWRLPIRWRTLIYGVAYLGATLTVWVLLDLVTGGQYTVHVWWGGQRTQWWMPGLFLKVVGLLQPYLPLLLLGLVLLPLARRDRHLLVLASYALVAPLTLLGGGETGGNHNHLLETLLAYAIAGSTVVGLAAGRLRSGGEAAQEQPDNPRISMGLPVWLRLAVFGILVLQLALLVRPHEWYGSELTPNVKDTLERFLVFMRETPGEILADDPGLLLMAGKPIRYNDASTMGPAAATGKWDQRGLLDDINNRRFSAIMIPVDVRTEQFDHAGRWSPEVIAAIREHYRVLYRDRIMTYIPR